MSDEVLGVEEFGRATEGLPIGTILPSILPPKAFLALALPVKGWMYANGDRLVDQTGALAKFMRLNRDAFYDDRLVEKDVAKSPDLRGVFIRGVDDGRGRREGDVEPMRKVGNYQRDTFASHSHAIGSVTGFIEYEKDPRVVKHDGGGAQTTSSGSDETRPRNVAIYYYVRVA